MSIQTIRPIESTDVDACSEFGLEAFRPVFASMQRGYGTGLFDALRPDWENAQYEFIRETIRSTDDQTFVAEVDGVLTGFVVLKTDHEAKLGQLYLMAVDPSHQGSGVGTALTKHAVDHFRAQGMTHAIVGTGDDEGHAPAQAAYRNGGFEPAGVQSVLMALEL